MKYLKKFLRSIVIKCINKSKLKSPMDLFLFLKRVFDQIGKIYQKIITVRTWWSINNTNNYVFVSRNNNFNKRGIQHCYSCY